MALKDYKDIELEKIIKTSDIKIGISWKSFKNRYASEKSLSLEDFKNIFEINNSIFFNSGSRNSLSLSKHNASG